MKLKNASIQPDLFEQGEPRVLPALSQKEQLATLVEALLVEIAAALANGEVGDDPDRRLTIWAAPLGSYAHPGYT